jgi:hypothetical protein
MTRLAKVWGVLLMIALVSSTAVAFQQPAGAAAQLDIDGQDVITASDAGGGALSSRDLLIIIAIGVAILVIVLVL